MCGCRGRLHSTAATTTELGGILIEFAKLSGTSFVCSYTSIMTLLSSSIIFLEPCLVQIMPMQFLAAKSLPSITGLIWLVHTMNFWLKERPFILNVHWVNPMGSMLVPAAVTTVGNLSLLRLRWRVSKVLRLIQLIDAPVSYNALILMFEVVIGKFVPVVGPTSMVQISTKWGSLLFTSL